MARVSVIETTNAEMVAAALELARSGLRVFPAAGKVPLTRRGFKGATAKEDRVFELWTRWPNANVAVATGPGSGVFVLDEDGDGGRGSLEALQDLHGALPHTVRSFTGRGRHYWFRYPRGRAVRCAVGCRPSVDIRGVGGYVIAPPSIHENGRRYAWDPEASMEGAEFAPAPSWLLDIVAPKQPAK